MQTIVEPALLIHTQMQVNGHKKLYLLTESLGFKTEIAFGAAYSKGRRGGSSFLGLLTLYLEQDSSQHYHMLDFEVQQAFTNLPTNLEAFYLASFYSEVLLKSEHSAEGYGRLFKLYKILYEQLDLGLCHNNLALFLLAFLAELGVLAEKFWCVELFKQDFLALLSRDCLLSRPDQKELLLLLEKTLNCSLKSLAFLQGGPL